MHSGCSQVFRQLESTVHFRHKTNVLLAGCITNLLRPKDNARLLALGEGRHKMWIQLSRESLHLAVETHLVALRGNIRCEPAREKDKFRNEQVHQSL